MFMGNLDYLLKNAEIEEVIFNVSDEKIECELSGYLSKRSEGIERFGCSDCNCESHLYYFKTKKEAIEQVKNAYDSIAMNYYNLNYFKKEFRK